MMDKILDWVEQHFVKAIILAVVAVILILVAVLFSVAQAADVKVSWSHPTQYTDNTPLALENIKETQVQYGTCTTATTPTFGTLTAEQVAAAPLTTITFTAVVPGKFCFRARTVDLQLRASAWTAAVAKTVVDIKPKVPTGVVVQ